MNEAKRNEESEPQSGDLTAMLSSVHDFSERKPISGYRHFECEDCGAKWREKSRDCHSPSGEHCPHCASFCPLDESEERLGWEKDAQGNLIDR